MTEIPEHLLQRTRARRQALGLPVSGGEAGAASAGPATPAVSAGGGAPGAPAGAPLPKGPVAPSGPLERAAPPPKPTPPYIEAYQRRRKVPIWALPVLVALPLWALFYAGTLEPPKSTAPTLLGEGAALFSANCASCHGATGGGGVGPQLAGGAVLQTFSNPVDHVHWVITGSAGAVGGKYGDPGKQSKGGMPSFGLQKTLTLEQIVAAVLDERVNLSGEVLDQATADKWAGLEKLADDPSLDGLYTKADIDAVLERLASETGLTIDTGGS